MAFPEHTVVMLAASSQQRSRSRIVFRAACVAACLLAAVALLSSTSSSTALNPVLESSPADAQLPLYHTPPLAYQLLSCMDLTAMSGTTMYPATSSTPLKIV
jgi:hypothetical protein